MNKKIKICSVCNSDKTLMVFFKKEGKKYPRWYIIMIDGIKKYICNRCYYRERNKDTREKGNMLFIDHLLYAK